MRGIKTIFLAALCACILPLCACKKETAVEPSDKTLVVASFYPIYALASPVLKGVPDTELRCLIQPQDGCLRNYSLSEWDVSLLSLCDVAVLGGRGLEKFESALTELGEEGPVTIAAMNGLSLIDEEKNAEVEDGIGHSGANPWLFLSIDGAAGMVEQIAASFCYIDPENEKIYSENMTKTLNDLRALKGEIEALLKDDRAVPVALLHEGLIYFAREYGLNVVRSVEREPLSDFAPDELAILAEELKSAGVSVVLIESQAPTRLKKDLEEAGFVTCAFDTLGAHMPYGDEDGYTDAMLFNARALKDAYARAKAVK